MKTLELNTSYMLMLMCLIRIPLSARIWSSKANVYVKEIHARAKSLCEWTYEDFHVHTLPTSGSSSVEVTWTRRRTPSNTRRNRRKKIRECDGGGMWENMNIMSNRWRTSPSIAEWKNNGIHSRPLLRKQFKQRPRGIAR